MILNSPRARLVARQLLREHGIASSIEGDVLWIYDTKGQRMRVNDGERLVYADGAFRVEG